MDCRAGARSWDTRSGDLAFMMVVAFCASGVCLAGDPPAKCAACHALQAKEFERSVHGAQACQACHGGDDSYALSPDELASYLTAAPTARSFEHGRSFKGKPSRGAVPNLCGDCHADVERMNAYGLRTDQLARYWTSGHGKHLKAEGDERVAVCIDCHGSHEILSGRDPGSRTHPMNVPGTCGTCHSDPALMSEYGLPTAEVDEYQQSVHGRLLLEQQDTGAPTCATCHGNHSAMPPGFATVGAVCGQCHQHAADAFSTSVHASQDEHRGCVQCHGGGEGRRFHLIERITRVPGEMIQRYEFLLASEPDASPERISETIHPEPKQIMTGALPTCMDCHEELEDDESLPKLFAMLEDIAEAERYYVQTGSRLEDVAQGVLLVDSQRFKFEDAKTHLIELSPIQHTLDNSKVAEKVQELAQVCDEVNTELDTLEDHLRWRHKTLIPIWIFTVLFGSVLYAKYKQLKRAYVKPLPRDPD